MTRAGAGFSIEDMKGLPDDRFSTRIAAGGYEAAHFTDDTCDGAVTVSVRGLPDAPRSLPAYALVAAPDFFPLADQLEIATSVRQTLPRLQEHSAQGAPWPLCEGRRAANIERPRPDALGDRAFDRRDETVTAIVAGRARPAPPAARLRRFSSSLTDAASNELKPGWDVSLTADASGPYLAACGLGSPFPEDSKLCAALNSFGPAAAPDTSRTFHVACTLTTRGSLPASPRRSAGTGSTGRSRRTSAVARAPARRRRGLEDGLWLVGAAGVPDWSNAADCAGPGIARPGYRYVFVTVGNGLAGAGDPSRLRWPVRQGFSCQISGTSIAFRSGTDAWRTFDRSAAVA